MVRVRISQDGKRPERRKPEPKSEVVIREDDGPEESEPPKRQAKEPAGPKVGAWRGMSERQWFISLLVASALLLLLAFRGCVLPSGIGPKPDTGKQSKQKQEQVTATPAAAEQASGDTYTVQAGDNLGKIAQKTGASIDAIAEANGISRNTILRVGQELKIP